MTTEAGWDQVSSRLPPDISRQGLCVVGLLLPSVSQGVEERRGGTAEKSRAADQIHEIEHRIAAQEFVEVMDAADMNVVQNQKSVGIEMQVEEVVFEIGERVGAGSSIRANWSFSVKRCRGRVC